MCQTWRYRASDQLFYGASRPPWQSSPLPDVCCLLWCSRRSLLCRRAFSSVLREKHLDSAMGININLIAVGFPNKRPMILRLCQKKSLSHRAPSHYPYGFHEVGSTASLSAVRSAGICAGREERQQQTDMVVDRVRQRAVHHRSYAEDAVKESGGGTVESDGAK